MTHRRAVLDSRSTARSVSCAMRDLCSASAMITPRVLSASAWCACTPGGATKVSPTSARHNHSPA